MQSMNVDLRHLRAFAVVAEELHFARAAARLHLSQPALSHTVRQLEEALGLRLLSRTTRAASLTPEGEIFLAEARAVLDRFDAALRQAERMASGLVGRLRVGYLIGTALDHMPSILRAFADAYPNVTVDVREFDFASPAAGLDTGETDVAILRPPVELDPSALVYRLLREARVACVSDVHPLAGRERVTVAELLGEPIIAAPGTGTWRDYWLLNDHREGRPPPVVGEAATFEAELQAVASGRGISITPQTAARYYARPGLAFPLIEDAPPCDVAVALPSTPIAPARRFAELARRLVADQGPDGEDVPARPS
jgi:DNA-binding transcriptional LysR family regulator